MVSAFEAVETPNARIRVATPADASFIATLENDAELKHLVGGPTGRSEQEYRTFLAAPNAPTFLIVESMSGVPMGLCGLLTGTFCDDCEVRVILMKDYWGHGLGTELVIALTAIATARYPGKRITAKIHPKNTRSIAVAARVGLVEDGTIVSGPYDGWVQFTSVAGHQTI